MTTIHYGSNVEVVLSLWFAPRHTSPRPASAQFTPSSILLVEHRSVVRVRTVVRTVAAVAAVAARCPHRQAVSVRQAQKVGIVRDHGMYLVAKELWEYRSQCPKSPQRSAT